MPLEITPALVIDDSELEERFVRASGAWRAERQQGVDGGTAALRRRTVPDAQRRGPRPAAHDRGQPETDEDVLVIDARSHRTQGQNREDARARLAEFIRKALVRPKRRQKTRPGAAAKQRRLDTKKLRAKTKQGRGKLRSDD